MPPLCVSCRVKTRHGSVGALQFLQVVYRLSPAPRPSRLTSALPGELPPPRSPHRTLSIREQIWARPTRSWCSARCVAPFASRAYAAPQWGSFGTLCVSCITHTPAIALCQLLVSDPVVIVFLGCRWQELLDYPLRARNFCYGIRPHHWCANALTYWGSFSHPR